MPETEKEITKAEKLAIAHRLQRQGDWAEAVERREELRAIGMTPAEFWPILDAEFPPLDVDEEETDADEPKYDASPVELAELLERTEQLPINVKDDLMWVYQSRGRKNLSPRDAPSLGAWDMLQYSRTNRPKYIDLVFRHLLQNDDDSKDNWKIDDGRILKVIDKLRRGFKKDNAQEREQYE